MRNYRLFALFVMIFVWAVSSLHSLQLLVQLTQDGMLKPLDKSIPQEIQERAYHEVLMKYDFPMCLALPNDDPALQILLGDDPKAVDAFFNDKLNQLHPKLGTVWVPTTTWELFLIYSFFYDESFRDYVKTLGYSCRMYNPNNAREVRNHRDYLHRAHVEGSVKTWIPNLDEQIVAAMKNPEATIEDINLIYTEVNHRAELCTHFLSINDAFINFASGFHTHDLSLNHLSELVKGESLPGQLLSALPDGFEGWLDYGFPFACTSKKEDMESLLTLFKEGEDCKSGRMIEAILHLENEARTGNRHLIFRGARGIDIKFPEGDIARVLFSPLRGSWDSGNLFVFNHEKSSYTLSYGITFLGGAFFSVDACAARYAQLSECDDVFHALSLPKRLLSPVNQSFFSVPVLSPLAEMLSDGEMFHAHTKLAVATAEEFKDKDCPGFYALGNRRLVDHTGFLFLQGMEPEDLAFYLFDYAHQNAKIVKWNRNVTIDEDSTVIQECLKNHAVIAEKIRPQSTQGGEMQGWKMIEEEYKTPPAF